MYVPLSKHVSPLVRGPPGGGRMVDDGVVPPLPRRVPGASGSPRPPAQVELGVISEDLRQRVLTAIAIELERDEAERLRNAQGEAGRRGSRGVLGTGKTFRPGDAASGSGAGSANGSGASSESQDASLATSHGVSPANGGGASLDVG